MAQKISRKALKHDEFVEAAFDYGQWLEKHWPAVAVGVGAILVVLLAYAGYQWWGGRAEARSETNLTQGLALYAAGDRLDQALSTFQKAAGTTAAGQVAQFYVGATQLRMGQAKQAAASLDRAAVSASSRSLADTARALEAEAYRRAGDLDKAAGIWRTLAQAQDGVFPPAEARVRLGDVLQAQGKTDEAKQAWREAASGSPDDPAALEARQKLGEGAGTGAALQ